MLSREKSSARQYRGQLNPKAISGMKIVTRKAVRLHSLATMESKLSAT